MTHKSSIGRDDAVSQLIAAGYDMLVVWDGVAHPTLAYKSGSPAARMKAALEVLKIYQTRLVMPLDWVPEGDGWRMETGNTFSNVWVRP